MKAHHQHQQRGGAEEGNTHHQQRGSLGENDEISITHPHTFCTVLHFILCLMIERHIIP